MSKVSQLELQREKVKNLEAELKKMHENLYSPFQYEVVGRNACKRGP